MPVLYGVFLYMGVASLNGVQVNAAFVFLWSVCDVNKTNLKA